jgi:hypothetical protein
MDQMTREKTLSEKTGINRDTIVRHRQTKLRYPDDWHKDGRDIVYTETGERKMMRILGLEGQKVEEPPALEVEEAFVVRHNFPNYKVVLCERANGEMVHVRVPHNRNFRTRTANGERMKVPIKLDGRTWTFAGGRTPRFPGKW